MDLMNYIGIAITVVGVTLRRIAFKILDKFFTYNVSIQKDHKLLKDGPYKVIRHPSYTGILLVYFGYMVFLKCNLLGFVTVLVPFMFFMIKRIKNEEEELTKHFKKDYIHYKRETWAIIPFLF